MSVSVSPVELIRKKRDGGVLAADEISAFLNGAVEGRIPDYQVTALLMAIFFRGMNRDETVAFTRAMISSGRVVEFEDERPKIDKHSTGGIGDKVSLVLAPLVAALDVDVPMVSGRGLGHTGGTLDKLEAIPGFRVNISIEEFRKLVGEHGLAMMGQTADFVPADKLLYSLRDVTATVECVPLITASILSKKVAEGISGLVLDIKVGTGAFMKTMKDAERLARSLVEVGTKLGLRIRAVLTDMNQPLGNAVGHSLEILECLELMRGKGPADLRAVTIELAAQMLVLGEKASSLPRARAAANAALDDGRALEKFREMCLAQGATVDVTKNPASLVLSPQRMEFLSRQNGVVSRFDGQKLGVLLARMGGGRQKKTDTIDYGVGFQFHAKLGTRVKKGSSLATIYYNPDKLKLEGLTEDHVLEQLSEACVVTTKAPASSKLIKKTID